MNKKTKFDWSEPASMRVPYSVVKQLDGFKQKHGYTSRPQAIIAAIEQAEKSDIVEDMRKMLNEFLEKEGENMVRNSLINIINQKA